MASAAPAAKVTAHTKPGGGGTTSGTPNLRVSTSWTPSTGAISCEPMLGGCTTNTTGGRLALYWYRSGAPVSASANLPVSFVVTNSGTGSSAATTATFSFNRTGEIRAGAEDFTLYAATVSGARSGGTLSGTRANTATLSIPGLAPGASATVLLTYQVIGAAGASISHTSVSTSIAVAAVSGETSTTDNALTLGSGSYAGKG